MRYASALSLVLVVATSCSSYSGGLVVALDGDPALRDQVTRAVMRVADELSMEVIPDDHGGRPFSAGGAEVRSAVRYRLHSPVDAPDESFTMGVTVEVEDRFARVMFRDLRRGSPSSYVRSIQERIRREIEQGIPPERITRVDRRLPGCYAP